MQRPARGPYPHLAPTAAPPGGPPFLPFREHLREDRERWGGLATKSHAGAGANAALASSHEGGGGGGELSPFLDWEDFLFHEHYVWHSARPRWRQGTVEVRPICQQPFADHMVASALTVGIAMAPLEVIAAIAAATADDGDGGSANPPPGSAGGSMEGSMEGASGWAASLAASWPRLEALHARAVAEGLEDPAVHGLASGVLAACEEGLRRRGLGEERHLAPLFRRLAVRRNPAQEARALLKGSGLEAAIAAAAASV